MDDSGGGGREGRSGGGFIRTGGEVKATSISGQKHLCRDSQAGSTASPWRTCTFPESCPHKGSSSCRALGLCLDFTYSP